MFGVAAVAHLMEVPASKKPRPDCVDTQEPDPALYSELVYKTRCGVIGGVGPAATVDFFNLVVQDQTLLFNTLKASALSGASTI